MDFNEYINNILMLMQGVIIRSIQYINKNIGKTLIFGPKALNFYLQLEYQLPTIYWELLISKNKLNIIKEIFYDELNKFVDSQFFRLEPLNSSYNITFDKFILNEYSINMKFNIPTKSSREIKLIIFKPYNIYSINYFNINDIYISKLGLLIKFYPNYINILKNSKLSCNYYRYLYTKTLKKNYLEKLKLCSVNNFLGLQDPLIDNNTRKRFKISNNDILRHINYYSNLTNEQKQVLKDYTGIYSSDINSEIYKYYLDNNGSTVLSNRVNILQNIILNAPPLLESMTVYKVARFFFINDGSNSDFNIGENVFQPYFNSTTYDNFLNFKPFIDEFQTCCAFTINIPKNSKVFIIGINSVYPNEKEVILPYGCSLFINDKNLGNLTYRASSSNTIIYNQLIQYNCNYSDDIFSDSIISSLDISRHLLNYN